MPAEDALLFIDANIYLDLYRMVHGKKLLATLGEQAGHVFITQQIVEEIHRNKIEVAATFLVQQFGKLEIKNVAVPDHLFGTDASQNKNIRKQMDEIGQQISKVEKDASALAMAIMEQISRSQDDVSKALAPIFAKAVLHCPEELQRARERRERGNPPGKVTQPIGDQVSWEQILSRFSGKKKLWIISRDGDYGTCYKKKGFANHFLCEELRKITPDAEIHLFSDIPEGIKHFAESTGAKAVKLPTPEEIKEIKAEEESLPPLDRMGNSMDAAFQAVYINNLMRSRNQAAILAWQEEWANTLADEEARKSALREQARKNAVTAASS